jgi:hypothetical protein
VGELVEVGTIEEANLSNVDKEVVTIYMFSWWWLHSNTLALRHSGMLLVYDAARLVLCVCAGGAAGAQGDWRRGGERRRGPTPGRHPGAVAAAPQPPGCAQPSPASRCGL